jgi:eukaryotic-like serine/threonine-protein kinase
MWAPSWFCKVSTRTLRGTLAATGFRVSVDRVSEPPGRLSEPPVLLRIPAPRSGPYHIGPLLGRGGSATVHLGFDLNNPSRVPVAVKRLAPEHARDRSTLSLLAREARILSLLVHRNIARLIDFGVQDGETLLVMEYVDGVSCGRLMNALDQRGDRTPLHVTLGIADAVLAALAYVHDATDDAGQPLGLVHGDLGPGNVLLGRGGECKLTDFGIAFVRGKGPRLEPGRVAGKLGYLSPEQARGEAISARSDLFSFGVMLTEMLLMCRFFPQVAPREILGAARRGDVTTLERARERLPLELRLILATALAHDPAERFQRAADLRAALRHHAAHLGIAPATAAQIGAWLQSLDLWPSQSGLRARVDPADCDLPELTALMKARR